MLGLFSALSGNRKIVFSCAYVLKSVSKSGAFLGTLRHAPSNMSGAMKKNTIYFIYKIYSKYTKTSTAGRQAQPVY
jgi:hypothetical protein